MCHRNMTHYAEAVKIVSKMPLEVKLPLIDDKKPDLGTYRPMNPSLIQTKQGYLVNVRCVNYRQTKGVYSYPDNSGIIRTRNILLKMDRNFNILEEKEMLDPKDPKWKKSYSKSVYGLEDVRLFEWPTVKKNETPDIWFTCSTFMTSNMPQIALCQLVGNEVVSKELLIGPQGEFNCEKNWMPAISNKHLYLIYSHDPLIRIHYNGPVASTSKTGNVSIANPIQLPWNLSFLRGSGVLLPYNFGTVGINGNGNVGFLAVVHEVAMDGVRRVYLHRFITYDQKMIPQKISLPFYFFQKDGIEYVCSSAFDHGRKHLILGLGINDFDACLIKISIETIRSMLMDFPNFL